ncbi:hypothetical protein [Streptomyces sp. SID69]|uniref:hypothetical protein n=1 Tax=Streptomyces sp. SID69 TaxID=2690323 RepID=UPI0013698455|nr:hypothetical protein [Streptomyces sp. SID69]
MAQVADREAQMEHTLIAAYDEYQPDVGPALKPESDLAHQTHPPHRPASRRRNRGR